MRFSEVEEVIRDFFFCQTVLLRICCLTDQRLMGF
jgi:hypothetical protein